MHMGTNLTFSKQTVTLCTIYFDVPTQIFPLRCPCYSWSAWPWVCPTNRRAAQGSTGNTIQSMTTATDPEEESPPFTMCVPLPELELHMLTPMHMLLDPTILDILRGRQVREVRLRELWWRKCQRFLFIQSDMIKTIISRISSQAFLTQQVPPAD